MTLTGQNVEIYRGDSKELIVTVVDSNSALVDLSGSVVNYVVYKANTIYLTKTTTSGVSLTDPTNGVLTITFSPEDTESLLGYYYHECEVTDLSGNISTIFTGKFTIFDSKA